MFYIFINLCIVTLTLFRWGVFGIPMGGIRNTDHLVGDRDGPFDDLLALIFKEAFDVPGFFKRAHKVADAAF